MADALNDERALDAHQRIEADIDNVRAAWTWAAEEGRADVLDAMLTSLATYFQRRARGEEGRSLMRAARRHLPEGGRVHGRLLLREARFAFVPDRDHESAEALLHAGVQELRRHDARWDLALGLEWLGLALQVRHGRTTEGARVAYEESLALHRALGDANGVAMVLNSCRSPVRQWTRPSGSFARPRTSREKAAPGGRWRWFWKA